MNSEQKTIFKRELKRAIELHGLNKLAHLLGVAPNTLKNWVNNCKVPADKILPLHDKTGIYLIVINPDLFNVKSLEVLKMELD